MRTLKRVLSKPTKRDVIVASIAVVVMQSMWTLAVLIVLGHGRVFYGGLMLISLMLVFLWIVVTDKENDGGVK